MNIFKKLFKREKSEPQIEEDLLPPLPEEAYDKEIGKYCTYNTKTQKITASVPLHEIVLDVPVSIPLLSYTPVQHPPATGWQVQIPWPYRPYLCQDNSGETSG